MSTALPTTPTTEPRDRRRRRGVVFLKFGLAGAALLGIAAAATSAAWTDNAWFSASASAATVQLQGSLDSTPLSWQVANTKGAALEIPAATFTNLVPGQTATYTVHVKNNGSVAITIAAPTFQADTTNNGLFTGSKPVTVALSETSSFTLDPNAEQDVVLTMTAPAWSNTDGYQGKTGAGWIDFSGTVGS